MTDMSFSDYIAMHRAMIEERRQDLTTPTPLANRIISTNCPFELRPANPIYTGDRIKYGALLIHGLFTCPFSLYDLGAHLQAKGILNRAILLPGHGTRPDDLLTVTYQQWVDAVRYGVESLRKEVEQVYLIGYSTGAALAIYHALQDTAIAGVILLSPAIKIKAPVDIVVGWHKLLNWLGRDNNNPWLYREEEIDYAKYQSVPFNAITQVANLIAAMQARQKHHTLMQPTFMAVSQEDETISSRSAIDFFLSLQNQKNKLLIYTGNDQTYSDPRISTKNSYHPDLGIQHYSHVSLTYSPDNPHYGNHGDYINASHPDPSHIVYGAYNRIAVNAYQKIYDLGLLKYRYRELTYNPDFESMANEITKFITEPRSP